MDSNPSIRKVYIVLQMSFPEDGGNGEYDSVSIAFVTPSKAKADDIERLWNIVQKNHYNTNWKDPEKDISLIALKELQTKYGINAWSGEELRVEEEELQ